MLTKRAEAYHTVPVPPVKMIIKTHKLIISKVLSWFLPKWAPFGVECITCSQYTSLSIKIPPPPNSIKLTSVERNARATPLPKIWKNLNPGNIYKSGVITCYTNSCIITWELSKNGRVGPSSKALTRWSPQSPRGPWPLGGSQEK